MRITPSAVKLSWPTDWPQRKIFFEDSFYWPFLLTDFIGRFWEPLLSTKKKKFILFYEKLFYWKVLKMQRMPRSCSFYNEANFLHIFFFKWILEIFHPWKLLICFQGKQTSHLNLFIELRLLDRNKKTQILNRIF